MPEHRERIAIAHPAFLGGGGEAVTLWAIQALAPEYRVTLYTLQPLDLKFIDQYYGTSLHNQSFKVVSLFPQGLVGEKIHSHPLLMTFRQQLVAWRMRHARKHFDLLISTYNEMDLGGRGLQYIHSPLFSAYNAEARAALHYPNSIYRRIWKSACAIFFGSSERRLRQNLSVTNSEWTASLLRDKCGIPACVIYPPVRFTPSVTPWTQRKDGFLCIGRFVREKRIESAIRVVGEVRGHGFNVTLHVVGHAEDQAYFQSLLALQRSRATWLTFQQDVTRAQLTELLHTYRYGIHAREAEQFGIGVAEMAASGCMPFVPSVGGQAEIVGRDPRLLFDNEQDAARKIMSVLGSPEDQQSLRRGIESRSAMFTAERFMARFRELIAETLQVGPISCTTVPANSSATTAPDRSHDRQRRLSKAYERTS